MANQSGVALASAEDASWPTFHHDFRRTGFTSLKGDMEPKTLRLLWFHQAAPGKEPLSPVIGDVDGDGRNEVIFGDVQNTIYVAAPATGAVLKSIGLKAQARGITLADVDGDRSPDLVVTDSVGIVYVFDGKTGNIKWWKELGASPSWEGVGSPSVGDIDGDGKPEVIVGSTSSKSVLVAFNGEDGSVLWRFEVTGAIVGASVLADADFDGDLDVLLGSAEGLHAIDGKSGKHIGKKEFGFVRTLAVGDVDRDGILDVVAALDNSVVIVVNLKGDVIFKASTGNVVISNPAIADLDGDGKAEIIAGSRDGFVYAWRLDGKLLWAYKSGGHFDSSPAVGDIDGDGELEVVIGSDDMSLHVINGKDGSLLFKYGTKGEIPSSPALGDVDEDGKLEIVFASDDGRLYVLDGPPSAVPKEGQTTITQTVTATVTSITTLTTTTTTASAIVVTATVTSTTTNIQTVTAERITTVISPTTTTLTRTDTLEKPTTITQTLTSPTTLILTETRTITTAAPTTVTQTETLREKVQEGLFLRSDLALGVALAMVLVSIGVSLVINRLGKK